MNRPVEKPMKTNSFFNTKKIIGFIIWSMILIVLISVALRFVVNIKFRDLSFALSSSLKQNSYWLWFSFSFAIFNFCFTIFTRFIVYWVKIREYKIKIKWYEWVEFLVVSLFIQTITPFSFGSEPYAIWWLKNRNLPIRYSAIIISLNTILWSFGQFLVTWPSFIYFSVVNSRIILSGKISFVYWLIFIGLIVDVAMMLFIFALSYSRHMHIFTSRIFNAIKRVLKMNYLTNSEITTKYFDQAQFKIEFKKELLKLNNLFILCLNILYAIFSYFAFVFFNILFNENYLSGDWVQIFNIVNIATTANNFVPIPSTEGTLQFSINELINFCHTANLINKIAVRNSLFLWRFFGPYLWLILGVLFGTIISVKKIIFYLKNHKLKSWFKF